MHDAPGEQAPQNCPIGARAFSQAGHIRRQNELGFTGPADSSAPMSAHERQVSALQDTARLLKYENIRLAHNLKIILGENDRLAQLVRLTTTAPVSEPADCSTWILA